MSSGVDWMYKISNANPEEPPIEYSIGISWASGAPPSELEIGLLWGLQAVRTAYEPLPGLGYYKQLWLSPQLHGPQTIADLAAKYLVEVAAAKLNKRNPLVHGQINVQTITVGRWLENSAFVCGKEIVEFAGVALDALFLENWEALAIAAEEWPKKRWGICPKVTALKVEIWGQRQTVPLNNDEALRVLDAAEAWARAVDAQKEDRRARSELIGMLDSAVVRSAIGVTKGKGPVSGLRHALKTAGYLA